MGITNTNRVKTDRKDAANIARCLAFHTYSAVYVPDGEDNAVKEYLRMRDDQKLALKKIKQQITAFVLRLGKQYTGGKSLWTENHLKWLRGLDLTLLEKETLQEYLITYDYLTDKLERLDARIEELVRNGTVWRAGAPPGLLHRDQTAYGTVTFGGGRRLPKI